jgi:predicted ATP-dependent protease
VKHEIVGSTGGIQKKRNKAVTQNKVEEVKSRGSKHEQRLKERAQRNQKQGPRIKQT